MHIIDSVLTPPMKVSETAMKLGLNSLIDALVNAKMVETVDMMAKVTIFAPNDQAFMMMKDKPTAMSIDSISKTLKYHIIPGTVAYSSMLKNEMMVNTADGEKLTIRIMDNKVYVNDRMVVMADILSSTGVIHVIDGLVWLYPVSIPQFTNIQASVLNVSMPGAMPNKAQMTISTTSSMPSASTSSVPMSNTVSKIGVSGFLISLVAGIAITAIAV
jgi:uncharacterized surface protein with fasciclin (FAS1) repeats